MNRLMFVILSGVTVSLAARQPLAPAFELASVKPSQWTEARSFIQLNVGGRFVAHNVTVADLIQQAYQVFDFQIAGAPASLDRERFDVQAILPATAPVQQGVSATIAGGAVFASTAP